MVHTKPIFLSTPGLQRLREIIFKQFTFQWKLKPLAKEKSKRIGYCSSCYYLSSQCYIRHFFLCQDVVYTCFSPSPYEWNAMEIGPEEMAHASNKCWLNTPTTRGPVLGPAR